MPTTHVTTSTTSSTPPDRNTVAERHDLGAMVVGGFYLVMGGVHLGLVSADPQFYEEFAARSFLGFVREGWDQIVMARPSLGGLLLMAGEVTLGVLLLNRRIEVRRLGWCGVVVFHLLLLLFGWWAWVWCVPAVVVLTLLARRDLRRVP